MIIGKDVILRLILKDFNFTDFVCDTGVKFDGDTTTISTKTIGTGSWRRTAPQDQGYTISLSGLIPLDDANTNNGMDLFNAWRERKYVPFLLIYTDDETTNLVTMQGTVLITGCSLDGPATGFATVDITMEGQGELIVDTAICSTSLGTLSGSNPWSITDIPATTKYIIIDLYLNGSLRSSERREVEGTSMGGGFIFLPPGDYTAVFTPECASGQTASSQQKTFTVS